MRSFSDVKERVIAPTRTYIDFDRPRPLSDWVVDGQVAEGHEASGHAFPFRVLDNPEMYAVIGEVRYSDSRSFLDFGIRPAWLEANSDYRFFPESRYPIYVCPDCGGKDFEHHKISIPNPTGIGLSIVKCPKDSRKVYGR